MRLADGSRSDAFEGLLEQVETPTSRLFDKLAVVGTLEDEERETFAIFLGQMLVRTEAFRQEFA